MWTLAGIQIYPDDDDQTDEPLYGEIQILEATETTLHYGGAKSEGRSLQFYVETEASRDVLAAAAKADANVPLVSDLGGQGNYRLRKLTSRRVHAVNQPNAWYRCTVELTAR